MSDLRDLATLCNEIDYLTTQVETLRKERDEARQLYCYILCERDGSVREGSPQVVANDLGWDCYKEAK